MAIEKIDKKKVSAAVLSAAIALNAAGMDDADLNLDSEMDAALSPAFVAEEIVDMPAGIDDDFDDAEEGEERKQSKFSVGSVITYLAGSMASLLTFLLHTPLTPLASKILGWVVFAAAVFGAVCFGLKKAFPNLPLKKVFNGKTIGITFLFVLVIIAGCEVVGFYHDEIVLALRIAAIVLGGVLVFAVVRKVKKTFGKLKPAAEAA